MECTCRVYRVPASCETCASVWVVALSFRAKTSAAAAHAWNLVLGSDAWTTRAGPAEAGPGDIDGTAPVYKDQRTVRSLHPAVNTRLTRLMPRHDLDTVNIKHVTSCKLSRAKRCGPAVRDGSEGAPPAAYDLDFVIGRFVPRCPVRPALTRNNLD